MGILSRSGRRGASDPIGGSRASTAAVQGSRSTLGTRTAVGAEGSFTTTTVTLPKSGRPRDLLISTSASIVQVQIQGAGKEFLAAVATSQQPAVLDISHLPEGTSVDVQTEAGAAAVIAFAVGYD